MTVGHDRREDQSKRDLGVELAKLCETYGLVAMYAFGSRAVEIAGRLTDSTSPIAQGGPPAAASSPDVDIGVLPRRDHALSAAERVSLMQSLESLFDAPRVDLVILGEASAFLAADVVRGELLAVTDPQAEADAQLYFLRRAADLAPLLREQWRTLVGSEL